MRAIEWTKQAARAAPIALAIAASAPDALADGVPGARAPVHMNREAGRDIRVALDQAVAVRLNGPAAGIAIGNPSIAGVSLQNDRLLFVTGRSYGSTNLVVVDADGRMIYSGRVIVAADETNVVMVTRGVETQRLNCAPLCRPQPDIGDGHSTFEAANTQINNHAAAASGGH